MMKKCNLCAHELCKIWSMCEYICTYIFMYIRRPNRPYIAFIFHILTTSTKTEQQQQSIYDIRDKPPRACVASGYWSAVFFVRRRKRITLARKIHKTLAHSQQIKQPTLIEWISTNLNWNLLIKYDTYTKYHPQILTCSERLYTNMYIYLNRYFVKSLTPPHLTEHTKHTNTNTHHSISEASIYKRNAVTTQNEHISTELQHFSLTLRGPKQHRKRIFFYCLFLCVLFDFPSVHTVLNYGF